MDLTKVIVPNNKDNIDNMFNWCKENKILCKKIETIRKPNTYSRPILIGFEFYFETEEDALAFKLRWL